MPVEEKLAKRVEKYFDRLLRETTIAARSGDNEAAITLIKLMTAQNKALAVLGWEWGPSEDGERRYIVPIERKRKKETRLDIVRMRDKVAELGGCDGLPGLPCIKEDD